MTQSPPATAGEVSPTTAEVLEAAAPYRPASGFEGALFMEAWCDRCQRDEAFRNGTGDSCPIAADTMCFSEDDPAYPKEWREDGPEGPRCTAFQALQASGGGE